jgi:hypothetical protein
LLLAPAAAFAQADRASSDQRVETIVFGAEDEVDGTALKADLERVDTRPAATFSNLIRVRRDFRDKIRESALP